MELTAASALDSVVLGPILGDEAVRAEWSDRARTARYLEIEAALAAAQAQLGVIPPDAAAEIEARCDVQTIDFQALAVRTEQVGYPVLGVVEQLVAACENGHGQWCHWGATTQDVTDTATVLQLRHSLQLIDAHVEGVRTALVGLARTHRDTPMAARTNLQQAVPTTFGLKAAVWLSGVRRSQARLTQLRERLLVAELGGAAGTLASLGPEGPAVRDAFCEQLGLGRPVVAWHTMRDAIGELAGALAVLAGVAEKIATDVKLLAMTEVAELAEPDDNGRRGVSSTMPQKRNPISCAYVTACATSVRSAAGALLQAQGAADLERSTGPWQVEWIQLPQLVVHTAGAMRQCALLLDGLQVHPDRMLSNARLTGGLINAEAVMMALAPHIGRERAHDLVHDVAQAVLTRGRTFADALLDEEEVASRFDRAAVERLLDPTTYLGSAGRLVDAVLEDAAG